MARCAGLVFLFLVCPFPVCFATDNIGCLFSESLCNQQKEWCFDDFAFGRCLPLYGNLHEQNMFRYDLRTDELHTLEQEMQRLFMLGYRWSHTYTQCVLQLLLTAIKDKVDVDVNPCNAELDQDLEGALKAIEGDEVEHIDPRNLAIVRFKPSIADPHSDYADELYYPPDNDVLPPYKPIDLDEEVPLDSSDAQYIHIPKPNMNSGSNVQLQEEDLDQVSDEFISRLKEYAGRNEHYNPQAKDVLDASSNEEWSGGLPLPIEMFYQEEQPPMMHRYDYRPLENEDQTYNLPLPPGMKKRSEVNPVSNMNSEKSPGDMSMSSIFRKLLRRDHGPERNLKQIAKMLTNIRHGVHEGMGPRTHVTGEPIYYPTEPKLSSVFDYEESRFDLPKQNNDNNGPKKPAYEDKKAPTIFKSLQNPGYNPYLATNQRNQKPADKSLPELMPPKQDKMYISDDIHPRYDPPASAELEKKHPPQQNAIHQNNHKVLPKNYYDNSISRFNDVGNPLAAQEAVPNTKDSIDNRWNADEFRSRDAPYDPSLDYNNGYGENVQYGELGATHYPVYGYYLPYPSFYNYGDYAYDEYSDYVDGTQPQNNVKKDDEVSDYGNILNSPNQHNERYDEKKPGPPFKQYIPNANTGFGGMMQKPESLPGGGDWMRPMTRWLQEGLYPMMKPGGPFYEQTEGGHPDGIFSSSDPVHMDEVVLDKAVDENAPQVRMNPKEGLPHPSKHIGVDSLVKDSSPQPAEQDVPEDSYVYITINGEFQNEHDARQLVNMILHYAGLENNRIEHISIKKNLVAFKLPKNDQGITPAELAEKIEELRPKILEKTHIEITQSGIGTKNALSGVVYQANDRQMQAAAAIVCGVCGALVVSAAALFLLRRHSRSKAKLQGITSHDTDSSKDYQDLCRARMATKDSKDGSGGNTTQSQTTHATAQRISSLSKESDNGNNSPSSRSSTSSWSEEPVISNMDISTGHMVLSYMEDHLRNKDRLEQEWIELCAYEAEPSSTTYALKEEHAQKNRYPDTVTYDHNRVVLNEHTNMNGLSYINASSITDHDPRNPVYIATQGPLPSTTSDFWQLVWEQGSVVIVMLTRLNENEQTMCHRYWPDEGSDLYHIYEVHLVSEHIWCDDYLVRSFYLKNIRTGETRTVTQFHFLSWTESATPSSTKALLEFRRKVNKSYRGRSCPIIVHCSDGAGRTGTYCLIDMVLNRMVKGSKEIDIAATLEHIRDQRPLMVKTKPQFEFVLMAVAEEVHAILKALPQ